MRNRRNRMPVEDSTRQDGWYYDDEHEDVKYVSRSPDMDVAYDPRRQAPAKVSLRGGGSKNFKRQQSEGRSRSRSKYGSGSPAEAIVRIPSDKTGSRSGGSMERREANSYSTDKSGRSSLGRASNTSSGRGSHGSRNSGSRHSDSRYSQGAPTRDMPPGHGSRSRGKTRASYGVSANPPETADGYIPSEHGEVRGRKPRGYHESQEEIYHGNYQQTDGPIRTKTRTRERSLSRERTNPRGRHQHRKDRESRRHSRARSPQPTYIDHGHVEQMGRPISPNAAQVRGVVQYERSRRSRSPTNRDRSEEPYGVYGYGRSNNPQHQWKPDDWNMTETMRGIRERRDELDNMTRMGQHKVIEIVKDDDISRSVLTGDDTMEYYRNPKDIDRFRSLTTRNQGQGNNHILNPSSWRCTGLCGTSTNTRDIVE